MAAPLQSKGIRVFLESGDIKLLAVGPADTVQDVLKRVADFLGVTVTAHYALRMEHQETRLSMWINPRSRLLEVDSKLLQYSADGKERWKYFLRLRFVPNKASEILAVDVPSYNYYFDQLLNRFITGTFQHIAPDTCIKLGCLALQVRHAESGAKKFDFDKFEKTTGLNTILPAHSMTGYKPKDLKKIITTVRKEFGKLSGPEARSRWFEMVEEHAPNVGLVSFNVQLTVQGESSTQTQVYVSPAAQFSRRSEQDTKRLTRLAFFRNVAQIFHSSGDLNLELTFKPEAQLKNITLLFLEPKAAEEFSTLVDGYVRLNSINVNVSVLVDKKRAAALQQQHLQQSRESSAAGGVGAGDASGARPSAPTRTQSSFISASSTGPPSVVGRGTGLSKSLSIRSSPSTNAHVVSHGAPPPVEPRIRSSSNAANRTPTLASIHSERSASPAHRPLPSPPTASNLDTPPPISPRAAHSPPPLQPQQSTPRQQYSDERPPPPLPSRTSSMMMQKGTQEMRRKILEQREDTLISPSSLQKIREEAVGGKSPSATEPAPPPPPPRDIDTVDEMQDHISIMDDLLVRIARNDLVIGGLLGEGQFGSVNDGIWKGRAVAVKTLKDSASAADREEFLKEAATMSKLDHPHIVLLHGVCLEEPVLIITEIMPLGDLREYLRRNENKVQERTLITFMWQISSALAYLEERKLVHRDIATRNVLVQSETIVKVSDFGLSRTLLEDDYYKSTGGKLPIKWLAPECINYRRFTTKSDVWSFGVCCWEMLTFGEKPFKDLKNRDVIQKLEEGVRLAKPTGCDDQVYSMMQKTWAYEPVSRPSFRVLYSYLAGLVHNRGGVLPDKVLREITAPKLSKEAEKARQQEEQRAIMEKLRKKMQADEEQAKREEQERLMVLKDRVDSAQNNVRKRLYKALESLQHLARSSRSDNADFVAATKAVASDMKVLMEESLEAADIPNMSHSVCDEIDKVVGAVRNDLTGVIEATKKVHQRAPDANLRALVAELMQRTFVLAQNASAMWSIIGTVRIVVKS